jgi:hypothetical protein
MNTKVISFGVPAGNNRDALVIVTKEGTIRLSKTERDTDGAERKIRTRIRSRLQTRDQSEFHTHKNRDNSFAYAMGQTPLVWPEDERL